MIAFTSAIESLRLANHFAEQKLFSWSLFSPDGLPVAASNGVEISVDAGYRTPDRLSAFIVCAGVDVQDYDHKPLIDTLRRLAAFQDRRRLVVIDRLCLVGGFHPQPTKLSEWADNPIMQAH